MSYTRRILSEQADRLAIPRKTIAALAETGPSNVSLFFSQNAMSRPTEDRIAKVIREIAAFSQRYGSLKVNLENAEFVKILLGKINEQSYTILTNLDPTEYLIYDKSQIKTTKYLLQASGFDLVTAVRISAENADKFPAAVIIDNPYCGVDDRVLPEEVSSVAMPSGGATFRK